MTFIAKVVGLACVAGLLSVAVFRLAFNPEDEQQIRPEIAVEPLVASLPDDPPVPADGAPRPAVAPIDPDLPERPADVGPVEVEADDVAVAEILEGPTDDPGPRGGGCVQTVATGALCGGKRLDGKDRCILHISMVPVPPELIKASPPLRIARSKSSRKTRSPSSESVSYNVRTRSEAEKRRIWRELHEADDRATWEANRIVNPADYPDEHLRAYEPRVRRYTDAVLRKYGMSEEDRTQLEIEAFRNDWLAPSYPSFDIESASRGLRIKVYARSGSYVYHRKACRQIEGRSKVSARDLHDALTMRGSVACAECMP